MDQLEKYIVSNREKFQEEPGNGHLMRFSERLNKWAGKRKKLYLVKQLLKVAAIALLVVLSSLWTFEKVIQKRLPGIYAVTNLSPEFKEAQAFYISEVNKKYAQISHSTLFPDSIQKQIVLQELTDMDVVRQKLQQELKTTADDERVVNALIEHYQLKLDIMNQILSNLEEIKTNTKQTDHEKIKL